MAKKLRRKDLRQPDEFVTITMKFGQWLRDNQRLVAFAVGALVIVVVSIAIAVQISSSSRISSSSSLWIALNSAAAPVVAPDDQEDFPEEIEHFKTYEARSKASVSSFQKVIDEHEGSPAGQAARLGLASTKFSLGEFAEARTLYEAFLSDTSGLQMYEAVAVEGAGFCYEAQKNYDKALEYFRRLEKIDNGDQQDLAKYHQGRILELMNKQSDAAELYRGVVRRSEQATDAMVTNGYAFEMAENRLSVVDPSADVLRARSKGRGADLLRKMLQGGGPRPGGMPMPPGAGNRPSGDE